MLARAITNGIGYGALGGAVVGAFFAVVNMVSADSGTLGGALVFAVYGAAIGAIVGLIAGVGFGLLLGLGLRLLLGPAEVPRRAGQLPGARALGVLLGLLPLVSLFFTTDAWGFVVFASVFIALVIAGRVPTIVFGITRSRENSDLGLGHQRRGRSRARALGGTKPNFR